MYLKKFRTLFQKESHLYNYWFTENCDDEISLGKFWTHFGFNVCRNGLQCAYLRRTIDETIINETLCAKNLEEGNISDTVENRDAEIEVSLTFVKINKAFHAIETARRVV